MNKGYKIEKKYAVYTCEICGKRHEMAVVTGRVSLVFSCLNCGHKIPYDGEIGE